MLKYPNHNKNASSVQTHLNPSNFKRNMQQRLAFIAKTNEAEHAQCKELVWLLN